MPLQNFPQNQNLRTNRDPHELRLIQIEPNYLRHPKGSALIRFGDTWVLCTVSLEERVPPFLLGTGQGWVTAEYSMLPGSSSSRISRAPSGRSKEIERLIGRSLRAAVDRKLLGQRTLTVDCDVIQADGGTRTAAITGGFVALALAIQKCLREKVISKNPLLQMVAAVSVGMVRGEACLDLDYEEDSQADVDMNVVMSKKEGVSNFIELQGTAEKQSFDQEQLSKMTSLAILGINQLFQHQAAVLEKVGVVG